MKQIKSEKGFSLAELMVAAGLVGIISLGVIYGTKVSSKQERSSKVKLAVQTQLNIGLKHLSNFTKGISWSDFDFDGTYFIGNNMNRIQPVSWNESDVDTIANRNDLERNFTSSRFGNIHYFLDSTTYASGKSGNISLFFSRCVDVDSYKNPSKSYGLQEALDIDLRPYLLKEGKNFTTYCAPAKTTGKPSSHYAISGVKGNLRVMSFYYKKNTWIEIPSKQERSFLLGAGHILFMNRNKNPDGFIAYNYVLDDPCLRYETKGECNRKPVVKIRNITGPVQSTGVHDSGFMVIQ